MERAREPSAGERGQPAGFVDGQELVVFKQNFEVLSVSDPALTCLRSGEGMQKPGTWPLLRLVSGSINDSEFLYERR